MKRVLAILMVIPILAGCKYAGTSMASAMAFRNKISSNRECSFQTEITADYGDKSYSFSMECKVGQDNTVAFTVTAPDSIQGITGAISDTDGRLTFDDNVLLFEPIAEGILSPVSAPWFLLQGVQSGYIEACSNTNNGYIIHIQDNYIDKHVNYSVWMNQQNIPVQAEIIWEGMRIMSMKIEGFAFL